MDEGLKRRCKHRFVRTSIFPHVERCSRCELTLIWDDKVEEWIRYDG